MGESNPQVPDSLPGTKPKKSKEPTTNASRPPANRPTEAASTSKRALNLPLRPFFGTVERLSPNVLSVRHWDRLMNGALYAATSRVDWATLLRRSFDVDVLACPSCQGRLRVLAVITEREPVGRILSHLRLPTEAPPLARARDPDDELDEAEVSSQLAFDLA